MSKPTNQPQADDGKQAQSTRNFLPFSKSFLGLSPVVRRWCGLLLLLAVVPLTLAVGVKRSAGTVTGHKIESAAAATVQALIARRCDEAHAVTLCYTLRRQTDGGLLLKGVLENTFVWDLDYVNLELTVAAATDGAELFRDVARELRLPRNEGMPFTFRLPALTPGTYVFTFAYEYDLDGIEGYPSAGPFDVTDFSWFEHEIVIPAH